MYSQAMTAGARLQYLGQLVERRISELGLEYAGVARSAGFSVETLSKIRKGVAAKGVTYRRLEVALEWEPGSVDSILDGGSPKSISPPSAGAAEAGPTGSDSQDEPADPRAEAVLTILEGLPTRVQAEVLRRLGDRLPSAARPESGAKGSKREAG